MIKIDYLQNIQLSFPDHRYLTISILEHDLS